MKNYYKLLIVLVSSLLINIEAQAQNDCQDITVNVLTTPAQSSDSIVRICAGQEVVFLGNADFSVTDVNATYDWKINTVGGFSNTTTLTHTFTNSGVYVVDFIPTDSSGCPSRDCNSRKIVHVSGSPFFTGTSIPDSFCLGKTVSVGGSGSDGQIIGETVSDSFNYNCAPPVSDTTFLPDGNGVSYTTSIPVTCFTSCDTIQDGTDILGVCLNVEHSYLGDLELKITCPSGKSAILKQYPGGGGTYLGGANDDNTLAPGVGSDYCFTDNAIWGTILEENTAGNFVQAGNPASNSMSPGSYKPFQTFDSLIGCPLNGDWTITVKDNLSIDNGYIFGWGIEFNTNVSNYNFTTSTINTFWTGEDIVDNNGNTVTIQPSTPGQQCYTFNITDNFNCTYDTTLCTIVVDPGNPGVDSSATVCPNIGSINLMEYLGGLPNVGGTWTGPSVSNNGILDPANVGVGTFDFTYTVRNAFCDSSAKVTLNVVNSAAPSFSFELLPGCTEDTVKFTNNTVAIDEYKWEFGDNSAADSTNLNPTHIYQNQGDYYAKLIVTDTLGCIDSLIQLISINHPIEAKFTFGDSMACQDLTPVQFSDQSVGSIQKWEWDFGDGTTSIDQNPVHTYTEPGLKTIRLVVTDDIPCTDTITHTLFVEATPIAELSIDKDSVCLGDPIIATANFNNSNKNEIWDFGDGTVFESSDKKHQHNYSVLGTNVVTLTINSYVCPQITAQDSVYVKPFPYVNLGLDTSICLNGAPIVIQANVAGNKPTTTYKWNTGNEGTTYTVVHPGSYTLAADQDGCITEDEIKITKDCYIDIPNVFTPNGDNSNDYFFPRQLLSKNIKTFSMTVYNRWGQIVFKTDSPNGRGWDGKFNEKAQPAGVYVYQISVVFNNDASEKYTGNVTLVR